ncbi:MAG: 50S ribosomal protein L37ae [Candidatus Pacearchaeota archaeon]
MAKTKKVKSSGRLGAKYGTRVRKKLVEIESKQRKKQTCIFCNKKSVKRVAAGIWFCKKCKKKFTGNAYYLS